MVQQLVELTRTLQRRRTDAAGAPRPAAQGAAVWALAAVLAAGATLATVGPLGSMGRLSTRAPLPWWALIAAFGFAEVYVFHLHFRRDTNTVGLAEIPLVMGLLFASPTTLVLSRVIGAGSALALHRRQSPIKLAFNVALFSIDTVVAVAVFRTCVGSADPFSARGWLAALTAGLAECVCSVTAICVASGLRNGWVTVRPMPVLRFSPVVTVINTTIGVACARLLAADLVAAAIVILPVACLIAAYRLYMSEREKHEQVRFLYETGRALSKSRGPEAIIATLLREMRRVFRADIAELVILPASSDGLPMRSSLGASGDDVIETAVGFENAIVAAGREFRGTIVRDPQADDLAGRRMLTRGLREALIVPLRGDASELFGSLLIGKLRADVAPFKKADLNLAEGFARQVSMSLENARLELNLLNLAYNDSLTQLANRAFFIDRVEDALTPNSDGSPVAVLLLDLDDFKTVNDGLGHAAGDDLLVKVADRLRGCLRGSDIATRLGGDEFAILVRDLNSTSRVKQIADRVIAAMDAPFHIDGSEISIYASIGVVVASPGECAASELMSRADVAMYRAKARGKACYEVFEPAMQTAVVERHQLKADLQRALADDQLEVWYQPIVDLVNGRICGAEALVRWHHPKRGMLSPEEFIPLAEDTGLVIPLGWAVLEKACREVVVWRRTRPDLSMSVNVSSGQLRSPAFASQVARLVAQVRLPASALMLEVTEGAMVSDERSKSTLRWLRAMGVRIMVDDFGTGYSSLSYLRQLPVDGLKVAKQFVDAIENGATDRAFAKAIIRLGETLHLGIVAEGIERPGQLEHLRQLGCVFGQGFHFCRPLPAQQFAELLAHTEWEVASEPVAVAAGNHSGPAESGTRPGCDPDAARAGSEPAILFLR